MLKSAMSVCVSMAGDGLAMILTDYDVLEKEETRCFHVKAER